MAKPPHFAASQYEEESNDNDDLVGYGCNFQLDARWLAKDGRHKFTEEEVFDHFDWPQAGVPSDLEVENIDADLRQGEVVHLGILSLSTSEEYMELEGKVVRMEEMEQEKMRQARQAEMNRRREEMHFSEEGEFEVEDIVIYEPVEMVTEEFDDENVSSGPAQLVFCINFYSHSKLNQNQLSDIAHQIAMLAADQETGGGQSGGEVELVENGDLTEAIQELVVGKLSDEHIFFDRVNRYLDVNKDLALVAKVHQEYSRKQGRLKDLYDIGTQDKSSGWKGRSIEVMLGMVAGDSKQEADLGDIDREVKSGGVSRPDGVWWPNERLAITGCSLRKMHSSSFQKRMEKMERDEEVEELDGWDLEKYEDLKHLSPAEREKWLEDRWEDSHVKQKINSLMIAAIEWNKKGKNEKALMVDIKGFDLEDKRCRELEGWLARDYIEICQRVIEDGDISSGATGFLVLSNGRFCIRPEVVAFALGIIETPDELLRHVGDIKQSSRSEGFDLSDYVSEDRIEELYSSVGRKL